MAKVNVNTASRDELIAVGGLRPEIVDEIMRLRRKEKITSAEALEQVPGVGPATIEQLKKALDFGDQRKGSNGDDREAVRAATRTGAETAETAGESGLRVVRRAADAVAETERAVAQRATDGTAELGRVLVDLTVAQTRHNLETLNALSAVVDWDQVVKAVDWDRAFQIQSDYLRTSLERAAQLTQRYLEVTQTVVTAAASTVQREAKKAA
jgi:hypothetical protein